MWKILLFLDILGIIRIEKNTTTTVRRYANELISPRTMDHLIEKKYRVSDHYLCTKHILGCPELYFWRVRNAGIRSYDRL